MYVYKSLYDNFVQNVFLLIQLFEKYPLIHNLAKKFRDLEARSYNIKVRGIGGIIIRIFPLLELTVLRLILNVIKVLESFNLIASLIL